MADARCWMFETTACTSSAARTGPIAHKRGSLPTVPHRRRGSTVLVERRIRQTGLVMDWAGTRRQGPTKRRVAKTGGAAVAHVARANARAEPQGVLEARTGEE